jgi:hypothetical protein
LSQHNQNKEQTSTEFHNKPKPTKTMGCSTSALRRSSKKTVREEIRDHDEEAYLSLRRRFGMPNQHKDDGYEFGLCVKE